HVRANAFVSVYHSSTIQKTNIKQSNGALVDGHHTE
ncbi:hypothetical protein A2U01_0077886, partial [Trifolium medium]|nr:hypothetical protein [Trifolium medium]